MFPFSQICLEKPDFEDPWGFSEVDCHVQHRTPSPSKRSICFWLRYFDVHRMDRCGKHGTNSHQSQTSPKVVWIRLKTHVILLKKQPQSGSFSIFQPSCDIKYQGLAPPMPRWFWPSWWATCLSFKFLHFGGWTNYDYDVIMIWSFGKSIGLCDRNIDNVFWVARFRSWPHCQGTVSNVHVMGQLAAHFTLVVMFHDVLTTFDRFKPTSKFSKKVRKDHVTCFFFQMWSRFLFRLPFERSILNPGFVFMPVWPYAILIACAALFLEYGAFKEWVFAAVTQMKDVFWFNGNLNKCGCDFLMT